MSLVVYGRSVLLRRFKDLVRDELGQTLGQYFELDEESGSEARFRDYLRGAPTGATAVQIRFFEFLNQIIRDRVFRVEIEIVEDEQPPFYGRAWGPRQLLDIADIEAIPAGNRALSRVAVIVHEIAERFWLVTRGYHHPPNMSREEWRQRWWRPAHEYALRREAEVTGWLRTGEAGRFPESRRSYELMIPRGSDPLSVFARELNMFPPPREAAAHFTYRQYRVPPGTLYPSRRRVTLRAGPYGPPEVQEVPVNPRSPRPLGH